MIRTIKHLDYGSFSLKKVEGKKRQTSHPSPEICLYARTLNMFQTKIQTLCTHFRKENVQGDSRMLGLEGVGGVGKYGVLYGEAYVQQQER